MPQTQQSGPSAPSRRPLIRLTEITQFTDHAGQPVTAVAQNTHPGKFPLNRLSLHLYPLAPVKATTVAEIGTSFLNLDAFQSWGNARNRWPRVDVYRPQASVEACIEHHKREKEHRVKTNGPHIVPTWSRNEGYRNVIFVIDNNSEEDVHCPDWEKVLETGLLCVRWGWEHDPEEDFIIWEAEDLEAYNMSAEDEGLVDWEPTTPGEDPRIDRVLLRPEDEDKLRVERIRRVMQTGQREDDHRMVLSNLWIDMTGILLDCTYRSSICRECDEGIEHPRDHRMVECDKHYINGGALCATCGEC